MLLGNPKDSVWEDWGTLGKIREITTPPEEFVLPNNPKKLVVKLGRYFSGCRCFRNVSHEKNPRLLSIESWLFNRDPYFMVYEIIPI